MFPCTVETLNREDYLSVEQFNRDAKNLSFARFKKECTQKIEESIFTEVEVIRETVPHFGRSSQLDQLESISKP